MTISLASAFHPRGEIPRLKKFLSQLRDAYAQMCVSVPPTAHTDDIRVLEQLGIAVVVARDWSHGRHASLQLALESSATHIHYTDLDRLLRWVETRPDEWRATVARAQECDCLIVGRTARASATHPRALIETEAISNLVISHLLANCHCKPRSGEAIPGSDVEIASSQSFDSASLRSGSLLAMTTPISALIRARPRPIDFSAGSKGFSRRAAEFLIAHSPPGRALGMDAEWIVLLHRAGSAIDYVEVDGLDWESADQFAEQAADADAQRRAAEGYDADPKHWARRVAVAMEIVQAGLDAAQRTLKT
ncbi:hypothetical protein ANRL1_01254 [Anaerolineae bacterium]|nr:hypothetical protein ANRL1_01254 [Anaerolineae bacterium]